LKRKIERLPESEWPEIGWAEIEKLGIDYWAEEYDDGGLSHVEIEEALIDVLDNCEDGEAPEEIVVTGYERATITLSGARILDWVLEYVDERYGDPDGAREQDTAAMMPAADALAASIVEHYDGWACDSVITVVCGPEDFPCLKKEWADRLEEESKQ